MPESLPLLVVESMGGGANTGIPTDKIDDDEQSRLINLIPDGPGFVRRGGTARITINKLSAGAGTFQELTSFHRYKSSDGIWALLVGAEQSITILDAGAQNVRLLTAANEYVTNFIPWVWAQYKDIAYAFRTGPGMVRVQVTPYERVSTPGMDRPAVAPTLSDGAVGVIPAANFYGVVTCYNTRTGAESNPSDVSAVHAHTVNFKIAWTNIGLCPPDQANARRLYRTLPNQTGSYYLVTTLENNSDKAYAEDNKLVEQLGSAVSFKNGRPPANLLMGVVWHDRMFVSDGTNVYWSQIGLMESFYELDALPVFPDDGHFITGLHADEDRLYIQKTNGIHYLTGSDRGTFELHTLDTAHGGWAFHTLISAGGRLYWLGWDDIYVSTGGPGVPVSHPKMRRYLDKLDRDKLALAHATVVADKELVLFTAPLREEVDLENARTTTLAYNYKTDAWSALGTPHKGSGENETHLNFLLHLFDRFEEPVLWAAFTHNLFTYNDPEWPYDDANAESPSGSSTTIACSFRSKAYLSSPGAGILVRRVKLLGDPIDASATIRLYLNGNEVSPAKTRSVSLAGIDDWHSFNMSTLGRPASSVMVEVLYSGVPSLALRGMALEVARTNRTRRAL